MINGISIPVLTQFKFYPVGLTIGDSINFQNVDNTLYSDQSWEGIYHSKYVQPVCRFWNDLTPGIDFQIHLDVSVLSFANLRAALIDSDGNIIESLVTSDYFTISGTLHQVRIYANVFTSTTDQCLRIKLYENGGDDIYYSEIISIADTHEGGYPFEFSNFENDFGLIFDNGAGDTWTGKMLLPLRMCTPGTRDEREVYMNDVSELTTLRSLPVRVLEIESYPVSTWFAEKVKMLFSCSDLSLNKYIINTEESPSIELVEETDVMQISGAVQLNEFADDYLQSDNIDTKTELLTSWADTSGWTEYSATGNHINYAINDSASQGIATSNNVSLVTGESYLIEINIDGDIISGEAEIDGQTFTLEEGVNIIILISTSTGVDNLLIKGAQGCDFEASTSMLKN